MARRGKIHAPRLPPKTLKHRRYDPGLFALSIDACKTAVGIFEFHPFQIVVAMKCCQRITSKDGFLRLLSSSEFFRDGRTRIDRQ